MSGTSDQYLHPTPFEHTTLPVEDPGIELLFWSHYFLTGKIKHCKGRHGKVDTGNGDLEAGMKGTYKGPYPTCPAYSGISIEVIHDIPDIHSERGYIRQTRVFMSVA